MSAPVIRNPILRGFNPDPSIVRSHWKSIGRSASSKSSRTGPVGQGWAGGG